MIKIEFEEPENGWLPVKIKSGEIEEYFLASNIPENPVYRLESVLDSAITGVGGEVCWHLEPVGYFLKIYPANNNFHVTLEYSNNAIGGKREQLFHITGGTKEIVLPIWRALRKIQSHNYSEFGVSQKGMESITKYVNAYKLKG
ncbi:hypothetical protein [Endozoicomonas numazuensis]|uniref:hypothetical protein n=1 Tax=Endozoicomonas numazuensis TaxID=1137799 RepID=UPI001F3AE1E7|nr:hypothetical protein [Endozoicomonas numazuensis]